MKLGLTTNMATKACFSGLVLLSFTRDSSTTSTKGYWWNCSSGKVSHHHLNIFYFRDDWQTLKTTDKNGYTYATWALYPISQHTLTDGVSALPFNNYFSWMPIVIFGYGMEVDEYQHTWLGDLDNVWNNAHDCWLLDLTYTMPISLLNVTWHSHNIKNLMELSDDYLASPLCFLF